jgi:hypothetical protein
VSAARVGRDRAAVVRHPDAVRAHEGTHAVLHLDVHGVAAAEQDGAGSAAGGLAGDAHVGAQRPCEARARLDARQQRVPVGAEGRGRQQQRARGERMW